MEQPYYPSGVILMWTNGIDEIPPGWVICDGNNGTPDLINKYPKSMPDSSTEPGATGGENKKNLSSTQLPEHNHSANINTSGAHGHGIPGTSIIEMSNNTGYSGMADYNGDPYQTTGSTTVDHNHSATTDATGSSSDIDNRPLSLEAVFIQKI